MVVFSPIIVQDTKKIYGYNFIAPLKVLKARKKKLALTSFYYVSWEIWLGNSKKLICIDQSRFSHTHENSKIFNITSKYFSFFNNTPPAWWVAHITRRFLTCYPCLYYSFLENIGSLTMQGHQLVRKDHRYSLEGLNCKKICSTLNRCTWIWPWPVGDILRSRFFLIKIACFDNKSWK